MTSVLPSSWAADVRLFWLVETRPEDWFKRDADLDRRITERFRDLHDAVAEMPLADLARDAATAVAAVLVLDQFPRNMFRGTPRAFATDALARAVADRAVSTGLDAGLSKHERVFLYLPFEHGESLADQERSVALISSLGDAEYTRYAIAHRDIIARFGRYPHRNAALGRVSTAEEVAFLAGPNSRF